MTTAAILALGTAELRAAALVLQNIALPVGLLIEGKAVEAMLRREVQWIEALIASREEAAARAEASLEGLADAVADHAATGGEIPGASSPSEGLRDRASPENCPVERVAPSASSFRSGHLPSSPSKAAAGSSSRAKPNQNALRLQVRAAIQRRGMLQKEAAREMGVPAGSLSAWLSGMSVLSAETKARAWLGAQTEPPPDQIAEPSEKAPPRALETITAELEDEARELLASGEAKGALDLFRLLPGSLDDWQAWCERERAGERSAA